MDVRKYAAGDVVKVMAQNVLMTVESTGSGALMHRVNCVWFDAHNQLHRDSFNAPILEFVR